MVWAFSGNMLVIFSYHPPARLLPEAYAIALQARGLQTNAPYCYEARISHERFAGGEWVFKFQPNPDSPLRTVVYVAMNSTNTVVEDYVGDRLITNSLPSSNFPPLPPCTKDFGVIEFTEGTPQHFGLDDNKSCSMSAKHVASYISINLFIETTNAAGKVMELAGPGITISPGRHCDIVFGDVLISLTPKWKMP